MDDPLVYPRRTSPTDPHQFRTDGAPGKRLPVLPDLFQMPVTNFWNSLEASGRLSPAPSSRILQFVDTTAPGAAIGTLPLGRILSLAGAAVGFGDFGVARRALSRIDVVRGGRLAASAHEVDCDAC